MDGGRLLSPGNHNVSQFPGMDYGILSKAIAMAKDKSNTDQKRLGAIYEECAMASADWITFIHHSLLEEVVGEYFALPDQKKSFFMYACLGVAEQHKNPSKAVAAFRTALKLEQNDVRVWAGLMELWTRQENWDSIMEWLEEITGSSVSSTSPPQGSGQTLKIYWKLVTHAAQETRKLQSLLEVMDKIIHAPVPQKVDRVWSEESYDPGDEPTASRWLKDQVSHSFARSEYEPNRKSIQCQQAMLWRYRLGDQIKASSLVQEALLASSDIYHFSRILVPDTPGIWTPEFDSQLPWFLYQYIEVLTDEIDSAESDTTRAASYQLLMRVLRRCEILTRIFSDPNSLNVKERELTRLVAVTLYKHNQPQRASTMLQQPFQLVLEMVRETIWTDSRVYGPRLLARVLHTTGFVKDASIAMSLARFSQFLPNLDISRKPEGDADDATTARGYVDSKGIQNAKDSTEDAIQLAVPDFLEAENRCWNDLDCLRPVDQRREVLGPREVSYHCMSCYSVVFCEPCYQLHVHGSEADKADRVRWCNPTHPLIKLPIENWTLRSDNEYVLTENMMTIDGEGITVGKWLDKIERMWTPTIVVY